jgi:phosphoglycolate phosphatase-like HAD superfamily hydrolase
MRAILFDFDGPIFNGRSALEKALRETMEKYKDRFGMPAFNPVATFLYSPRQIIALAYAEFKLSSSDLDEIRAFYEQKLKIVERQTSIDPAIAEFLKRLRDRGMKCFIISSRSQDNLVDIVTQIGLLHSFDKIFGHSEEWPSKLAVIEHLAGQIDCETSDFVMIGDSDQDFEAARDAKAVYYHAAWGGEPTRRAHLLADATLTTLQDLIAIFSDEGWPAPIGQFPHELKTAIERRQFSVFAGAGISVPSGVGGWDSHYVPLLRELDAGPMLQEYDLPELLQLLASDTQRATAVFDRFRNSFRKIRRPNSYHYSLLRSGAEHIWTTNYDNLFEIVISTNNPEYSTVNNDDDLRQNFGNPPLMIKINGDFERAKYNDDLDWGMVFLQEQFDVAEKRREELWRLFEDDYRNKSIIFVGVSFDDPTLRRITATVARSVPRTRYPHYLLMHLPRHPAEAMKFRLFKNYLRRYRIEVLGFKEFTEISRFVHQVSIIANRPIIGFSGSIDAGTEPAAGASINGETIAELCGKLGADLARRGYRVTSGHGPGVGVPSVEGAFSVSPSSARFYLRRRGTSSFSRTAPAVIVPGDSLEAMRERFIPECDLLLAVAGRARPGERSGTLLEIERAMKLQIPVLILKQAGGDAGAYADTFLNSIKAIYDDKHLASRIEHANVQLHEIPATNLNAFCSAQLPDVIEDLIAEYMGSSTPRPSRSQPGNW